MPQVNTNLNNQSNIMPEQTKTLQQQKQQPIRLPNYYIPDTYRPSAKEIVKENPIYDMFLKPFIEHPLALLGTWLGISVGLDAYSRACGGDYNKSLVKKVADFGDNIENSKIVQSKPVQTVLSGFKTAGNAGKKVAKNSAILRAMKETPTMPEWQLVKSQMFNQKQEIVQEFIKITDILKLGSADIPKLKDLGLNDSERTMLKKAFNVQNISQIPEEKAVNQILLNRIGKTPEEIKKIQDLGTVSTKATKEEILKAMGLTTDKLKLIKDDVYGQYINDVKTAADKVKGKVRIGAGHYSWLGPLTKPFERSIGCDEVYNKLHSIMEGPKTATGRFCSKLMQMIHRGFTFGGGKLGALIFISPLLVELGVNVKNADKDQKIGTAANGFVDNISWVFTFPLALRMLHSIGGIKNASMGKDKVEEVRKLVEDFNKKVETTIVKDGIKVPNPDTFKTKLAYDLERAKVEKRIKELRKVDGQNIFTKGIRKLAGILTPDLCRLNSYRNSNIAANTARKLPAFFRNCAGIPIRIVAWAGLSMGVLGTLLTKCTTAIFGKSYDSMKQDERKDELKKQQEFLRQDLNERMYEIQRNKQYGASKVQAVPQGQMITSRGKITSEIASNTTGLIPKLQEEKTDNYTYIPSQQCTIPHPVNNNNIDTYTYIPSSDCIIKPEEEENKRRYIPSQSAANIQKTFDNSGLQSALDRAQKAEVQALKVLAGNFDGMV